MSIDTNSFVCKRVSFMKFCSLFLGVFCLCGSLCAENMRIWRNKEGERFEGQFVRVLLGKVMLETAAGEKIYIPLKNLSKWDTKHLASIFIPEVRIRVSDSSRTKFRSKNALADDIIRIVTATTTIEAKEEVESDSLRMEVYLIGEEFSTDDFKLLEKGAMALKFIEENEYTCQMILETESRKYREYNRRTRGCLYLGYVVIIFDRNDQMVYFRSDIGWILEEQLDTLRQFEKSDFFDNKLKSRPVPRPKNTGIDRVGVQ